MEEILASIKRIIADDGTGPAPLRPGPRHDAPPIVAEPVLELTEPVAPATPVEPQPAAVVEPQPVARPAPPVSPAPAPAPAIEPPGLGLVSQGAACASRQSLSALSSAVRPPATETTLDGMVRDLLRPMLRDWLDAHLPALVETLVAREIARISTAEG